MIWTVSSDVRDQFSQGVHRDILIVPHATNVIPNPGGPPIITNKRPVFEFVTTEDYPDGVWKPKYENGELVRDDVDWVIDNSVLIKEKFRYTHTINSDDNLSFSGCNAAMVQFTIRNKKEYVEELDDEGEGTGNYYWEQEIPNLQYYEFVKKAPDGTEKEIIGELEGNYVIKVYTYINGDSSNLMFLGMFRVEEDKITGNGYERQITAYDFLATFRDMDIFYWYKHLFEGINIATNDYEEFTQSEKKADTSDIDNPNNFLRNAQEQWTIGDALKDLIYNLSTYDMIVWEDAVDDKGKPLDPPKKICKKGMTINNPSEYGREYKEGALYSGFGMPIMIDQDILTPGTEEYIPEEPGNEEYERYGYMKIFEMPFMQDPNVIKSESLSMGKFLEDIGRLAGRYPYIRIDRLDENDYVDPSTVSPTQDDPYPNRYNNYERCILTFKPLPSSKNDKKVKTVPDMYLSNHEIVKGFEHESYMVDDIELVTVKFSDKTEITYKRLTKGQRVTLQKGGALQSFTLSDNLFCSYLVTKSDNEDIKKNLDKYAALRDKLFGPENKNGNMSADSLFSPGYLNMKYRGYTPYKLTTYADPCREVGDRILINFEDKITGEQVEFYSYILERSMDGIQKCMDTYEAKGDISNPIFSNYQTGTKYQSGTTFNQQSLGFNPTFSSGGSSGSSASGMTPSDLVQYWRNFGIRLLDKPSDCEAKFVKGSESSMDLTKNHIYYTSSYPQETYIKDGDTTNKLTIDGQEIDIIEGDYVHVKNYQHDDPAVLDWINNPTDTRQAEQEPLYVYTVNGSWNYVGLYDPYSQTYCWYGPRNTFNLSAVDAHFLDEVDNWAHEDEDIYGNTSNKVVTRLATLEEQGGNPEYYYDHYYVQDRDSHYKAYGGVYEGTEHTDPITIEAQYGDVAEFAEYDAEGWSPWSGHLVYAMYQYPGFWTDPYEYPDLTKKIENETKKYVSLKWSDPQDITDWKPTPATWEGTVIIRKENSAPLHRWDGEKVVRTTTRDKYKTEAYKDEDIKPNKVYYYGFFPYYIKISDPDHPIRFYTFTKTIRVETGVITYAPVIESITADGNTATIVYSLIAPEGSYYTSIKLYGKIGSTPSCDDTDDIVMDLDENETSVDVDDLDNELYYFVIKCIDNNEAEVTSNVETADLGFDWDGSEITILWSGDNNRMTASLSGFGGDELIWFAMYSGDTIIYDFFSFAAFWEGEGSIEELARSINIGFIIDNNKQIAKPSCIYYICNPHDPNYQKYTYNTEVYMTDAQMQAVYNWLLPGLS